MSFMVRWMRSSISFASICVVVDFSIQDEIRLHFLFSHAEYSPNSHNILSCVLLWNVLTARRLHGWKSKRVKSP